MKTSILLSVALLAHLPGAALAACDAPSTQVVDGATPDLTDLLTGNTMCVGSEPTWDNQEYHAPGGDLIDWKRGPTDAVDPTLTVGTWDVTGSDEASRVNYNYPPSTSYSFSVWANGDGTHSFCIDGSEAAVVTMQAGQGACSSAAAPLAPSSTGPESSTRSRGTKAR